MTNEEKIKEVCSKFGCESSEVTIKALSELAEWKDNMFNASIDLIKEQALKYWKFDPNLIDDFLDISGGLNSTYKAYRGEMRTATPEEIKEIKEIMKEQFDYYGDLYCFWFNDRLYAKTSKEWWMCLAGRMWGIDLEKKKARVLMKS